MEREEALAWGILCVLFVCASLKTHPTRFVVTVLLSTLLLVQLYTPPPAPHVPRKEAVASARVTDMTPNPRYRAAPPPPTPSEEEAPPRRRGTPPGPRSAASHSALLKRQAIELGLLPDS